MPLVQVPDYAKLPDTLFVEYPPEVATWRGQDPLPGFKHCINEAAIHPLQQKQMDLYIFHDKRWCADSKHMLGWAREVIHSLKASDWMQGMFKKRSLKPEWLVAHAYRWMKDGTYLISGTEIRLPIKNLIALAQRVQSGLEAADVTIDQWGSSSHEDWHEKIKGHVEAKAAKHPMLAEFLQERSHIEVHTMLANHGNAIHHAEYPA
jgi:hypothetical protein